MKEFNECYISSIFKLKFRIQSGHESDSQKIDHLSTQIQSMQDILQEFV